MTWRAEPLPLDGLRRADLAGYFEDGWALDESIFGALADAAFTQVADPLRYPLLFYLGHTASFFPSKMTLTGLLEPIDPELDVGFAVGVDEDRFDDPICTRALGRAWPTLPRVRAYRRAVHERVAHAIASLPLPARIDEASPLWALLMALEHQRIHIETTSMLVRQLPLELVRPPPGWTVAPSGSPPRAELIAIAAGPARLGHDRPLGRFIWDSEDGHEEVDVAPFLVARHLTTNAELDTFVAAGGYQRDDLWTAEGRAWKAFTGARRPPFWRDGQRLRTVFEEIPMPWAWPAEVTYHEAQAFCAWKGPGHRVLTEAEHVRLRAGLVEEGANLGLRARSPTDVDASAPSADGLHDLRGNVWEWVGDLARPLAGFKPHPLYPEFSTPGFGGHRMVLGASWISTGAYGAPSARSWFRDHFLQHVGFRLARSG